MISMAVDFGPANGSRLRWGVKPRNPDRLFIRSSRHVGCLVVGLGLLAAAAAVLAYLCSEGGIASGSGFVLLAVMGALTLGRRLDVFDRRAKSWTRYHGSFLKIRTDSRPLSSFRQVVIEKENRITAAGSGRTSVTTVFHIRLEGRGKPLKIDETGVWESAVPVGEVLARFLRIPLNDTYQGEVRGPEHLDDPLALQHAVRIPERPANAFCRVQEQVDGNLHVRVPRPVKQATSLLLMVLFVFIFWTLPVSFFANPIIGLLPLLLVVPGWVKAAFGYSADIDVTPDALVITTRGLVFGRRVTFPAAELEHIIIHTLESGGPREMLFSVFSEILVARSDRAAVRFGYGLDKQELEWLRASILKVLQTDRESLARKAATEEKIPTLACRWLTPAGFVLGAILGNVLDGPWGVSIALPFLEHMLNAGAAVGFLLGCALDEIFARHPRALGKLLFLGGLPVAGAYLLLHGYTPAIQRAPTFEEWVMLSQPSRVALFWYGWLPVGAGVAAVVGNAVAWLMVGAWRALNPWRRRRPASDASPDEWPPKDEPGRWDQFAKGTALVFVAAFSVPCMLGAREQWIEGSTGGALGLLLLASAFHLPWIVALNFQRIRKWLSEKQWSLLGYLSVPWLPLLIGIAVEMAVAFDGDDESFPSGRWAAALACGAFIGAGVAMMRAMAWEVKNDTDLLLARLAVVDVWLAALTLTGMSGLCIKSYVTGNPNALPAATVLVIFALVMLYFAARIRQEGRTDV